MKFNKVFLLAALLVSGPALSASLEGVQGDVWVRHEKGFRPVQGSTELLPGDKVKVGRNSLARIVYEDGCKVKLRANSLATVAEDSPCSFVALDGDGAGGDAGGSGGGSEWMVGLGTLGAGGIAAGTIAATSASAGAGNNNNNIPILPLSP
jgi:hypothetical protein